ncbi:MAG: MOSC N-terminal beta barrel domain-containing protein [Pedobacter sp.]
MKLQLSEIYIYPIKSLGGISIKEAKLEQRGLQYDRKWLLIDENGTFITQRKHYNLAMLQVAMDADTITVSHKTDLSQKISFPKFESTSQRIQVRIWDDTSSGFEVNAKVSDWFSVFLNMKVKLVGMADDDQRLVDPEYALNSEIVSFADAYPCLIIGQAALDFLNEKLADPVPMNRFRPNFVFTGGEPHIEDRFGEFYLGENLFQAANQCARCVLTTVDQETGIKGQEPLRTLTSYRTVNKKVMFGQNLLHKGPGTMKVGDELIVKSWKA